MCWRAVVIWGPESWRCEGNQATKKDLNLLEIRRRGEDVGSGWYFWVVSPCNTLCLQFRAAINDQCCLVLLNTENLKSPLLSLCYPFSHPPIYLENKNPCSWNMQYWLWVLSNKGWRNTEFKWIHVLLNFWQLCMNKARLERMTGCVSQHNKMSVCGDVQWFSKWVTVS